MTSGLKMKEVFEIASKHTAFYTGGNIEWHSDTLFCQISDSINIFDTESGQIKQTIGDPSQESDPIHTFTTDGDNRIVTSHKSGLLKLWNSNGELQKSWKYLHSGPLAKLTLFGDLLASGGSDSCIRIWDLEKMICVANLKGGQGVMNVVCFFSEDLIFGAGDDGKILSWKLSHRGELVCVYSGHFSKVTDLVFFEDRIHFASLGRDKVIVLWELNKGVAVRTVALFEAVESFVVLPQKFRLPNCKSSPDGLYVAVGGEKGKIRVLDLLTSKEVYTQDTSLVSPAKEGLSITKLLFKKSTKEIAVITADHNIIIHNLKSFVCLKQYVGFSDEIHDIVFLGKHNTHLAVATNSIDIKLYENSTMNCQLLKGHTDLVLSLSNTKADPNLLLSSAKDNSIRLWQLKNEHEIVCLSVGMRHTASVTSACLSQLQVNFAVSVSEDTCLKLWEITSQSLTCTKTEIAHQKDINCVSVSPNDKIVATGSQDKTAKLWTSNLELIGVLRGHRRGILCIRFSPVDQIVVTSSADCSVRLWSIANLSCLKSLDGHDSSVLRVEFLSCGMQILSAGADGLIKLFSVKSSECVGTFEGHEGKIWALAVKDDESEFVSGDNDSFLIKWKDVTEEKKLEKVKEMEEYVLEEQKMNNYLQNDELLEALKLSLKLNRPLQTLKIVQTILKTGKEGLSETIGSLRDDQKELLLKCASVWNTNSKNSDAAQMVLNILIGEFQAGSFKPDDLGRCIEELLPYTDRHFRRLTQLFQDLQFVRYTVNCMNPLAQNL